MSNLCRRTALDSASGYPRRRVFGVKRALAGFLCFILCILASPAQGLASPAWLSVELLADVLMYHYLMGELRLDEAGQVLDRLLASGKRDPALRILEAEYCLDMHAHGRSGAWLARAGQASQSALKTGMAGWRGYLVRSRWNEYQGNLSQALSCARQAVDEDGAPRTAWEHAILLANRLGNRSELGSLLDGARERGFLDGNGLYTLGMIRLSEGRVQEAVGHLEGAERSGDSGLAVRAANALIVLYRERLDFVKAQQRVQTLASIFPGDSIYRQHALMLDFLLNGIPRQAVSLVGIDLGSVRYAEHRAILLLVAGETNAARRAVGMTNSSPSYAGAMVRYYLEPDSALRAALATALAGRAMQENVPDLADAWLVRAEDLLGQGVQTEIDWLKLRARVSLAKGDYGRARESASRVLALQAHDGEAMSLLAMTYMHLGRHDEALNLFTAAGDGDGLLAAALMRAREGEHGLAVRYAAALIKNAPLHGEAVRIQALSLEQLTMTNQALAALGAWHQAGGRDLSPLAVFARLEMALGRSQSALRLIDQTLAGIPTSRSAVKAGERGELAELFCLRGRILMGLGQFRPAEAAFAQAVSLGGLPEGKMVDLYLQHGDALLAIGRTARALSSWRRVQDLMPGEPRSRQRIKQHEPVTRQVLP